jgi:hypothetical protein
MLRAIIRRKIKHLSGAKFELFNTIDFESPDLQIAIQGGGLGEDTFEVPEVVGIECLDHISELSKEVQDDN